MPSVSARKFNIARVGPPMTGSINQSISQSPLRALCLAHGYGPTASRGGPQNAKTLQSAKMTGLLNDTFRGHGGRPDWTKRYTIYLSAGSAGYP